MKNPQMNLNSKASIHAFQLVQNRGKEAATEHVETLIEVQRIGIFLDPTIDNPKTIVYLEELLREINAL